MELFQRRFIDKQNSTGGYMLVDGEFYNFTLENAAKKEGATDYDTRIDAGTYQVLFRKDVTPLTISYQTKYDWFTWHLEIIGVPGRKNIYIHVGNNEKHTLGCVLVAWVFDATVDEVEIEDQQWKSVPAYERLYLKVSEALNQDEKVFITIVDK